jgi:hypothetical protein
MNSLPVVFIHKEVTITARVSQRLEARGATDIFLGNSTMEAGIDSEAYQRQIPQSVPLNLGIGWTSPIEHMLIFSKLSSKPGRRVFYGFVGTQLTDVPRSDVASLTGNRAMVYYTNPDLAMRLMGIRDWFTLTKFQVLSSIAAFVVRDRIWAKVERVRRDRVTGRRDKPIWSRHGF